MESGQASEAENRRGVLAGLVTYGLWGVFPIFFKLIQGVPPSEVLLHRVIWAVPFGALILFALKQWSEVGRAFRDPRLIGWLALSACCIAGNWYVYIWAVVNERVFEASLGYYINPLMYVLVGVMFFGEKLNGARSAAVALATLGVLILAVQGGVMPWASLALAILFTAYGVIRKQVQISSMAGLFAETALLFPVAAVALLWLVLTSQSVFLATDFSTNTLLVLAGPITVVPLVFFAIAARRLTLTTIGFMQFIAPTLQFAIAIYYGEELTPAHMWCFGCIWLAVAVFSVDAIRMGRRQQRALTPE